jgi:hypothetical protein
VRAAWAIAFVAASALACEGGAGPAAPAGGSGAGVSGSAGRGGAPTSSGGTAAGGSAGEGTSAGGGSGAIAGSPASGAGGTTTGASGGPGNGGTSTTACGSQTSPAAAASPNPHQATGWESPVTAAPDKGSATCASGAESQVLHGTKVPFCVKAHSTCRSAGANCPVFIVVLPGGARSYLDRVDDPARNGALVAVDFNPPTDGNDVKDSFAELPRALLHEFPGIDRKRVYVLGFSAGSGAITRALCHVAKGSDSSSYGTTSDLYAAMAFGGAPVGCTSAFSPIARTGSWDILSMTGDKDQFNQGDGGEASLRNRALVAGCTRVDAPWTGVPSSDPFVVGQDGSCGVVKKLSFGDCPGGDVVGYEFINWAHDSRYPGNRFEDVAWRFFQGRSKR